MRKTARCAILSNPVERFAILPAVLASQCAGGIVQGRKIQIRRDGFGGRYGQRLLGIVGGLKQTFFNLAITLLNICLRLFCARAFSSLMYMSIVSVKSPNSKGRSSASARALPRAAGLRQCTAVVKIGIAEMRVPVKIV